MLERWPHQKAGLAKWADRYDAGVRRLCVTSPTGGGKTLFVFDVIAALADLGRRVSLVSNRKILTDQIVADLVDARIPHGVRAANYEPDLAERVQICSMQTEVSRVIKRKTWWLHAKEPGDVVIFDEGHLHTNGQALVYRKMHLDAGARTLDITATPLGMGDVCDELIIMGTNSSLRECGALVMCEHFAPDEPDVIPRKKVEQQIKKLREGEDLSENQQRAIMGAYVNGEPTKALAALQGRIWANFQKINTERRPFICFGPGVNESLWIAQQFCEKGVRCAHVDGDHIWLDGELHRKTDSLWAELLAESKAGKLEGLSCRFVLREGFNAPWIGHAILATVFGSVQSYLQAGGRLLRAWPAWQTKTLQDHGGNFWRHGSLNVDRVWSLNDTPSIVFHKRADRIRENRERPPIVCPKCNRVLTRRLCPCGYEITVTKLPRAVVTTEGLLHTAGADYFPPIKRSLFKSGPAVEAWKLVWRRACSVKWYASYRQAEADYARDNRGFYPSRDWPLMPIDPDDIYRRVLDLPVDRLRGDPDLLARMRVYQNNQLAKLENLNNGQDLYGQEEAPAEVSTPDGAEA